MIIASEIGVFTWEKHDDFECFVVVLPYTDIRVCQTSNGTWDIDAVALLNPQIRVTILGMTDRQSAFEYAEKFVFPAISALVEQVSVRG